MWKPLVAGLMEAGVPVQEAGAGSGLGRDQHRGQAAGPPLLAPPALPSALTPSGQVLGAHSANLGSHDQSIPRSSWKRESEGRTEETARTPPPEAAP